MRLDTQRQHQLTRRAFVFGSVAVVGIGSLIGRLYYLQFLRTEEFSMRSEGNRVKLQLIPPPRGKILDRNGVPLANNDKNFRMLVEVAPQKTLQKTLKDISEIVPLTPERIKEVLAQAKASRYGPPIQVKEHMSWDELAQIEFNSPRLPGVLIDVGDVRFYPFKEHLSHLVGYIGAVTESELSADDQPLLRLPEFKIGKNGVEKAFEDKLRGTAGVKNIEVNVHGLPVRELAKKDPIPGEDMRLTIDNRLQEFTSTLIEGESAAVAVMEVNTGDMLALVSLPGFDPNSFSKGITQVYWDELRGNIRNPLLNKAIAGQYPPGSTFKMLVGLAALEEGIISSGSRVFCPGHFFLGNHQFNCWKAGGHGSVNYHDAVVESCDTFFYTQAQKLGMDKIAEMARKFGLGGPTGIEIPGEKGGIMPDPAWKRARYNQPWQAGDTINAGIGQGYVISTPLQQCVMIARMVNGGFAVKPRLWVPTDNPTAKRPSYKHLGIKDQHLQYTLKAMADVTLAQNGTAYAKRITTKGYSMGGKTGTAQVRKITQRGVNQETLPWEYRHHAWFVAFAPVEKPKYACCVLVEHGGGGSAAAAPIARDVMERALMLADEDRDPSLKEKFKEWETERISQRKKVTPPLPKTAPPPAPEPDEPNEGQVTDSPESMIQEEPDGTDH